MGFAQRFVIQKVTLTDKDIPTWQPGSSWTFRAERTPPDERAIKNLVTRVIVKRELTKEDVREAVRNGEDINELINDSLEREYRMAGEVAILLHMSERPDPDPVTGDAPEHAWAGPDFTLPETYLDIVRDDKGNPVIDEVTKRPKTKVHELAGNVPPITDAWIDARDDPEEIDRILRCLNRVWAGRSQADHDSFPGESGGVDGSDRGLDAAEEVPAS